MAKFGRNDLCYCGSGKKYKHCHWKADQDAVRSRLNTRRARQWLFSRLVDFSQRPRFEADYVSAFNLFWDGRRDPKQKNALSAAEVIRFLEWYLIDYRSSHDRQRIIDMFRAQAAGYIPPEERSYLGAWQSAQFRLFEVTDLIDDSGVRIHDLLRDESFEAQDENHTPTMKVGELYMARLIQRDDVREFILSVTSIPAEEKDTLVAFAREKYRAYQDAHFGAAWNEFLRDSNYLFNHYLLNLSGETATASGKVVKPTREEFQKTVATMGAVASRQ